MAEQKQPEKPKMPFRLLGNSGLKISVLGFGSMSFNTEKQTVELLKAARAGGCNFFDNAELYGEPLGNSEVLFGKALKILQKEDATLWRRSDIVITTKLFFGPSPTTLKNAPGTKYGLNELGLSRKHLREGMKASLERLQLEYVDVILAHRFDSVTPMEEIVRGFNDLIRSGQAMYWGTSMWPAQKITEAYWIAKMHNLIPPITEQPLHNMFSRSYVEGEYLEMYKEPYKIGSTTWSPLDAGILTGKYLKGVPKDSRMGEDRLSTWYRAGFELVKAQKMAKVEKLVPIAEKLGCSLTNLAIAWVVKNENVSCCLLGARNAAQLSQNFGALNVVPKLSADILAEIDKVMDNKPKRDALMWQPYRK